MSFIFLTNQTHCCILSLILYPKKEKNVKKLKKKSFKFKRKRKRKGTSWSS